MARSHDIHFLQEVPLFGGLSDETLAFIIDHAKPVTVPGGNLFFREGQNAESLFVLQQGQVGIYKTWNREEHLLRRLSAGDCFGEMALIDLGPRSATVKALVECKALELSAQTFFDVYKHNLEQFTLVYMNISRELSRRLRDADNRLFAASMGILPEKTMHVGVAI